MLARDPACRRDVMYRPQPRRLQPLSVTRVINCLLPTAYRLLRRAALIRAGGSLVLAAVLLALATACGSRARSPVGPLPEPPFVSVAIMGPSRLSAAQLAEWFDSREPGLAGAYRARVPAGDLIACYLEEAAAEGVTGDVAFVQAIVETGWFRFSGLVRPEDNNFAGIGATGSAGRPAAFPDPRTGVRAQIQHLRAYADASAYACTSPPLHNQCVDPRFALVLPKGKAPTWNVLGNGNWAMSPTYATSILTLYSEALAANGLR
jgi:hypothetical protein